MKYTKDETVFPAMLVAPEYESQVSEQWFQLEHWGTNATAIECGGRGAAWFLDREVEQFVLRFYQRGGLMARLSKDRYFFTDESAVRSFAEFRLLRQLKTLGLPVPSVVAAWYVRVGVRQYRAAIIVERLASTTTFPDSEQSGGVVLWERVGQLIRRFHEAGLDHVDLNCDNILVTHSALYLIDFDQCKLRDDRDKRDGWKRRNLARLRRSVDKRFSELAESERLRLWEYLITAYSASATS